MAEDVKDQDAAEPKQAAEIQFKCRFCGEMKPLSEMTIVARLFPRVMACRACERKLG